MSIAPLPATLEYLRGRSFAFYPPIRNIGRNEWVYRRATWSEYIVSNLETREEFSIPRVFIGEVSTADEAAAGEPDTVVELHRELELRAGSILPCQRRVIELPVTLADSDDADEETYEKDETEEPVFTGHRAPVISIRLEPKIEPGKWIGVALVLSAVACAIVAGVTTQSGHRFESGAVSRAWLELTQDDDYQTVLSKLGTPGRERSFERNGKAFRILVYPALHFSVVLTGRTVRDAHYAEALDARGHILGGDAPPLNAF